MEVKMICPNCGGKLEMYEEKFKVFKCQKCGMLIRELKE
jgi:predicted RNA-binding Zn-ribbon protein involved in translation (DUF1610 family)